MDTRVLPVSISSADRDHDLYPDANHYVAHLPHAIRNVAGIHLGSLELPGTKTQLTIEKDLNDKITFSEGLRIDLGEATRTVEGSTMYNNQIMIKEGANKYIVSVPAYLSQITDARDGTASNSVTTTDADCSGASAWYACYVTWQAAQSEPKPPVLKAICGSAGYVETITTSGTLTTSDSDTADKFDHGFVHLDALSVQEICSYLTFAFANYTTYSASPTAMPSNTYTFEYYLGKVRCLVSGSTSASIHFPTTANGSQTAFYGAQDNGFSTQQQLNSNGQTVTSLGYMLGLTNGQSVTTKTYRYKSSSLSASGFFASIVPRFLFEARLRPGLYTQSSLARAIPIAMNPLHFSSALNTSTTGACYFGFIDSAKNERIIVINEGKYTPETFCQALEYAFNRMDENGPYYSKNRFAYRGASLNHEEGQSWPALDLDNTVVYNVTYNFDTNKFTIESSWASSVHPLEPSAATALDTARPAPTFDLVFDPASLARMASQVSNLSTLCTTSNIDRIANVLGFNLQEYSAQSSYTSELETYIPRIAFPLSKGLPVSTTPGQYLFKEENPEDLGVHATDKSLRVATSCGTPKYMFPNGRYRATGFNPVRQNLNISTGATFSHESLAAHYATSKSTRPELNITNYGFRSMDYTLGANKGAKLSQNMYLAINNTSAASDPDAATIMKIDTINIGSTHEVSTFSIIDVGTGSQLTVTRSFIPIEASDNVRCHSVTNTSTNERCMLVTTHTNGLGTQTNSVGSGCEAYMTTRPFGNQVGDVVTTKYLSDTFISGVNVGTTPTINASTTLSTDQGLAVGEVLSVAGNVTAGNYHLVLGGDRTAVVQVLPGNQVTVVESGSKLVPSTTYELSHPIFPFEFEGIVVQQCNSGGHFQDSDNSQREQFLTSVPNLPSSTSCVAAKSVDGACMRMRIPYGLELNEAAGAGAAFPRSGNVQRIASFAPPRVGFHIEDNNASTKIKPGHAQDVMGLGRRDLAMDYTLTLPNAMNVDPVHYVMVKFSGLNSRRGEQLHYANGHLLRDVVGKVILGAPTTLVRSLVNKIEITPQTLTQVEVSFYLPDGKTKYKFHGLDHTLTLNLILQERTLLQEDTRKRKVGVIY
jgi:hypothetical protein